MDPQQIALVRGSFAEATSQPDLLARVFYERLFAIAPDVAHLFSTEPAEQQRKLGEELRAIVDLLDHVDDLVVRTSDLGTRHVAYGVTADHYEIVGVALLEALARVLRGGLPPETARAWRFAYNLVAESMQQGAAASTTAPLGG